MTSITAAAPERAALDRARIAGNILSGLATAFLLLDSGIKLARIPPVHDTLVQLGWPADDRTMIGLGLGLLVATILYAVPRTAVIGAILLTGYLGGAIAAHARIGSPLFTHTFFGVYLALVVWGGLFLRRPALRALFAGN